MGIRTRDPGIMGIHGRSKEDGRFSINRGVMKDRVRFGRSIINRHPLYQRNETEAHMVKHFIDPDSRVR